MANKFWIADAIKNKGSLRKSLGIKNGKNIPMAKLDAASNSNNVKTRKRAILAKTLAKFNK